MERVELGIQDGARGGKAVLSYDSDGDICRVQLEYEGVCLIGDGPHFI
jgi:hypothetical protein